MIQKPNIDLRARKDQKKQIIRLSGQVFHEEKIGQLTKTWKDQICNDLASSSIRILQAYCKEQYNITACDIAMKSKYCLLSNLSNITRKENVLSFLERI